MNTHKTKNMVKKSIHAMFKCRTQVACVMQLFISSFTWRSQQKNDLRDQNLPNIDVLWVFSLPKLRKKHTSYQLCNYQALLIYFWIHLELFAGITWHRLFIFSCTFNKLLTKAEVLNETNASADYWTYPLRMIEHDLINKLQRISSVIWVCFICSTLTSLADRRP